jgi:hypothetical protein
MELLSWIPPSKLSHIALNANPNVYDYMTSSNHYVIKDWLLLSGNSGALPLLLKNKDKINVTLLCSNTNPAAIPLIQSYLQHKQVSRQLLQSNPTTFSLIPSSELYLEYVCANPHPGAIQLVQQMIDTGYIEHIDWSILSANISAIEILKQHPDKIKWSVLSSNPSAMDLLMENPSRINLNQLCKNTHPKAIELLKTIPKHKINWYILSSNPSAIEFLEENKEFIQWYHLSLNPAIFQYNYQKMAKKRNELIHEELLAIALHPDRISKWLQHGLNLYDII